MEIVHDYLTSGVEFSTMKMGAVFLYDGNPMMRIQKHSMTADNVVNAVDLKDGMTYLLDSGEEVRPMVNSVMRVKP